MQPYFLPYAGYFRLLAMSDLFVLLDDVQFPRRGWVHRNRLHDREGKPSWLTLPLKKGDRDELRICDLHFRTNGGDEMRRQLRKFPLFDEPGADAFGLATDISDLRGSVADYLHRQIDRTCQLMKLPPVWARSSELGVAPGLRGWERLVAIVRLIGGDTYINAPGGRVLYDPRDFHRMGIRLRFLSDYRGPNQSILQRLQDEGAGPIRSEIDRNLKFDDD
jgi:hypothetical protein